MAQMDDASEVGLFFHGTDMIKDPDGVKIIKFWWDIIRFMIENPRQSPFWGEGHAFITEHLMINQRLLNGASIRNLFEHPFLINVMACANTSWQIEIVNWFVTYADQLQLHDFGMLQFYQNVARRAQLLQLDFINMCEQWLVAPQPGVLPLFATVFNWDASLDKSMSTRTDLNNVVSQINQGIHFDYIVKWRERGVPASSLVVGYHDRFPSSFVLEQAKEEGRRWRPPVRPVHRDPHWPGDLSSASLVASLLTTRTHKIAQDSTLANICDVPLPREFLFLDRMYDPVRHSRRLTPEERDAFIELDRAINLNYPQTLDIVVSQVRRLVAQWREAISTCLLPVVLSDLNWQQIDTPYNEVQNIDLSPAPFTVTSLQDPRIARSVAPVCTCDMQVDIEDRIKREITMELHKRKAALHGIDAAIARGDADVPYFKDRELTRRAAWKDNNFIAAHQLIDMYYTYLSDLHHREAGKRNAAKASKVQAWIDALMSDGDISEWEGSAIEACGLTQHRGSAHVSTCPVYTTGDDNDADDLSFTSTSSMTIRQQHAAARSRRQED